MTSWVMLFISWYKGLIKQVLANPHKSSAGTMRGHDWQSSSNIFSGKNWSHIQDCRPLSSQPHPWGLKPNLHITQTLPKLRNPHLCPAALEIWQPHITQGQGHKPGCWPASVGGRFSRPVVGDLACSFHFWPAGTVVLSHVTPWDMFVTLHGLCYHCWSPSLACSQRVVASTALFMTIFCNWSAGFIIYFWANSEVLTSDTVGIATYQLEKTKSIKKSECSLPLAHKQ